MAYVPEMNEMGLKIRINLKKLGKALVRVAVPIAAKLNPITAAASTFTSTFSISKKKSKPKPVIEPSLKVKPTQEVTTAIAQTSDKILGMDKKTAMIVGGGVVGLILILSLTRK